MKGGTIKTKNAQNIAHIKSINAKHKIESKHKYNTYLDDFDDLDGINNLDDINNLNHVKLIISNNTTTNYTPSILKSKIIALSFINKMFFARFNKRLLKIFPNDNYTYKVAKTLVSNSNSNHKSNSNNKSKKNVVVLSNAVGGGKWITCKNTCLKLCIKYINKEIKSTAYMLRIIAASVITNKNKVSIEYTGTQIDDLTGIWKNDSKWFLLKIDEEASVKSRLIMGFGPSASGKTYCALKVIELMSLITDNFPKVFITVDGGILREQSYIYRSIVEIVRNKNKGIDGLSNLMVSGLSLVKGLFNAGKIKKKFTNFLLNEKTNNTHLQISLYCPETLGKCGGLFLPNCNNIYKDFIEITEDITAWIGLLIFQHKTHEKCKYPEQYKCVGTTQSGQSREIHEGKKYSSYAWKKTFKNGESELIQAPGYQFSIHNSGVKGVPSVFVDITPERPIPITQHTIQDFFKKNNWLYTKFPIYTKANKINIDKIVSKMLTSKIYTHNMNNIYSNNSFIHNKENNNINKSHHNTNTT